MRILAVDDDPTFLDLLTTVLTSGGYEDVVSCESASEALQLLKNSEEEFDCFLLDVSMPEKDGITLCSDIRSLQAYSETPIIMITASTDLDHVDKAFAAGATDYVSKPIEGLQLGSRIRVAKIISDSARRLSLLSASQDRSLTDVRSGPENGFAYEIAVKDVAGLRDTLSLENELLRLPSGHYNLSIFALKIENAQQLFDSLGAKAFHDLVTTVAKTVSDAIDFSNTSFTYAGKGLFCCVQFGRSKVSKNHPVLKRLCGSKPTEFTLESGEKVEVNIAVASAIGPTLWSGRRAAEALAEAMGKANLLASNNVMQRQLDESRMGGRKMPRRVKPRSPSWLLRAAR